MIFFLQGLGLGLAAGTQPGPFQAYLLARALRGGWRATWSSAFAPLISDGPIVLIVLLILVRVPDWLTRGLRGLGGLFLLYLAWGVLRSLRKGETQAASTPDPGTKTLLQSALINFLNPAPWLFWSTVAGPVFLLAWKQGPWLGVSFLIGFYGVMISVLSLLVALFAAAARLDPRIVRGIHIFSGLLLAAFAFFQIYKTFVL